MQKGLKAEQKKTDAEVSKLAAMAEGKTPAATIAKGKKKKWVAKLAV